MFDSIEEKEKIETHAHVEDDFNFNQITSLIYIGNNQCCHIALDQLLIKENIYSDLSLEENVIDNPVGAKAFLWLPVLNYSAPTLEQIRITNHFIQANVDNNQKVYIHCKNGHGRAPTIVIAYLISTGMKYEEALKLVKEKRPSMHLDTVQEDFLKKL